MYYKMAAKLPPTNSPHKIMQNLHIYANPVIRDPVTWDKVSEVLRP